jgi:uncharacterized protein YndB with AHSA1/START domain
MKDDRHLELIARGDREIVITRAFDAPRNLVFEALTTPALLKRWFLGPPGWSLAVCEIDLQVGGTCRFLWRRDSGKEIGMHGVYREVVPNERYANTEVFDDPWFPGECLVTTVLAEEDGRTILTSTSLYESREARDVVMRSGMERGAEASYNLLAELLASRETWPVEKTRSA